MDVLDVFTLAHTHATRYICYDIVYSIIYCWLHNDKPILLLACFFLCSLKVVYFDFFMCLSGWRYTRNKVFKLNMLQHDKVTACNFSDSPKIAQYERLRFSFVIVVAFWCLPLTCVMRTSLQTLLMKPIEISKNVEWLFNHRLLRPKEGLYALFYLVSQCTNKPIKSSFPCS